MENQADPRIYYLAENEKVVGPFDLETLITKIKSDSLIFSEPGNKWQKAEEIPEINNALLQKAKTEEQLPESFFQGLVTELALAGKKDSFTDPKPDAVLLEPDQTRREHAETKVTHDSNTRRKGFKVIGITLSIILVLVAIVLTYLYWPTKEVITQEYTIKTCFVDTLFIRTSKDSSNEYNKLADICLYGQEVKIIEEDGVWATIDYLGQRCYVATKYLLNSEDFSLLNNLFDDLESREAIQSSRYKLGLLNYLKSIKKRNSMGDNASDWHISARKNSVKPNGVITGDFTLQNKKIKYFACLLKNRNRNECKFLLFTFSDDGIPSLVAEKKLNNCAPLWNVVIKQSINGIEYEPEQWGYNNRAETPPYPQIEAAPSPKKISRRYESRGFEPKKKPRPLYF